MKKSKFLLLGLILSSFLFFSCSSSWEMGKNENSYNLADLNKYGEWIVVQPYGNVWKPFTVENWEPFDYGYWSYINNDWTWVSYEPFGWIVYHYGNWFDDPVNGWVWLPSYDSWSPGRVQWLINDDYISWAPLPPDGVTYRDPWELNDGDHWHIVFQRDFAKEDINKYRQKHIIQSDNEKIVRNAPSPQLIESKTHNKIKSIKSTTATTTLPKVEIQKLILPREMQKSAEKNKARVREKVMLTREKYYKKKRDKSSKK